MELEYSKLYVKGRVELWSFTSRSQCSEETEEKFTIPTLMELSIKHLKTKMVPEFLLDHVCQFWLKIHKIQFHLSLINVKAINQPLPNGSAEWRRLSRVWVKNGLWHVTSPQKIDWRVYRECTCPIKFLNQFIIDNV